MICCCLAQQLCGQLERLERDCELWRIAIDHVGPKGGIARCEFGVGDNAVDGFQRLGQRVALVGGLFLPRNCASAIMTSRARAATSAASKLSRMTWRS